MKTFYKYYVLRSIIICKLSAIYIFSKQAAKRNDYSESADFFKPIDIWNTVLGNAILIG